MNKNSASPKNAEFLRKSFASEQQCLVANLRSSARITHAGDRGEVNEQHFIDFLRKYLPKRYTVEKAIVMDSLGNVSDSIDVVIFDRQYTPTLLDNDKHRYVPAEAVYAIFECKPKIDKGYLKYAADKAASVRRLKRTSVEIHHAGGTHPAKKPGHIVADGVSFYAETLKGAIIGFFDLDSDQVREMVCEALQDAKFSKQPVILGNCVRVYYAEGYHVDVPSFRVYDAGTPDERQELAGKDDWRPSDPTEINVWFEARVRELNRIQEDAGGQLRRMVRLLKRFARSRDKKWNMPNGLKLTMLVDECFERSAERDDKAFYFLLERLNKRLHRNLVVLNRAQSKNPQDKLTKSDEDENMVEFRLHVWEALKALTPLWDEKCNKTIARTAWEWVFQPEGFFREFDLKDEVPYPPASAVR